MTASEFIRRYSYTERNLAGVCAGVSVHRGQRAGKTFIGVIDGDRAWIITGAGINMHDVARECYAAAREALREEEIA